METGGFGSSLLMLHLEQAQSATWFQLDADPGTIRGFHVGDARLCGVRIFDARIKIQHDAQWSVLTRASIF